MADFNRAFAVLKPLEFNSGTELHKNSGESGLTFCGIYEGANPKWGGWERVNAVFADCGADIKKASRELSADGELMAAVGDFYRDHFWERIKGDEIDSQKIANMLFAAAVNMGAKVAVRAIQQVVGVASDGVIGKQSLAAINRGDAEVLADEFADALKYRYAQIAAVQPSKKQFLNGWINRVERSAVV